VPATFLSFLGFLALWPLGLVGFAVLAVGLFVPKFRNYARRGLIWGFPGALALSMPFALAGFGMTGGQLPGPEFLSSLVKVFFAASL
jgi:hypothetical protein